MKKITEDVARAILANALTEKSVTIFDEIGRVAALIERDGELTFEQFRTWAGTTTLSASAAAQAALRFASQTGRAPWDEAPEEKSTDSPLKFWRGIKVVDWDDEVWTPKRAIKPVTGYKQQMRLRRCANCSHLVNIAHFGPPECDRPKGPKFEDDVLDAFLYSCKGWSENEDKEAQKRLLRNA